MTWLTTTNTRKAEVLIKQVLKESNDPHNIFTPFALCDEVVGKIPSLAGKILVVANLEFLYTMVMYGVDQEQLYFATPCELKATVAKTLIPEINIVRYDNIITKEDVDMKFDVVVGNPPYQPSQNKNTKNIWPLFIEMSYSIVSNGGYVALITPRTWTTNELFIKWFMPYTPVHINIDECAKWFPGVGSTFSYFVMKNTPPNTQQFDIVSKTGTTTLTHFPNYGLGISDSIGLSILNKTIESTNHYIRMITSSGYNTMKFSKNDTTVSWIKTEECKYPILHKVLKKEGPVFFYSSLLDKRLFNIPRVVVNIWVNNYKDMTVETELLTCEQFRHFPTNTVKEANVLKTVLLSPLYAFIAASLVSGGSFTNLSMSRFPSVDLTRSWTDEELYDHFNLTTEEIKLIEDTIK